MTRSPIDEAEYPIAAVSKLTGVGCHSLRIWERRYGFPVPHRTDSGHRRYSHAQVVVLRQLAERVKSGGVISELIAEFQRNGALSGRPEGSRSPESTTSVDRVTDEDRFLDLMISGDVDRGHQVFDALERRLAAEVLVNEVVVPALTETGERWFRGSCQVYQERVVTGFLRRKLEGMIEKARQTHSPTGPTAIVGCVQGERHEAGVLIVDLALRKAGWRVVNLGVDLPVEQYGEAVDQLQPDALALSFVHSRSINKRFEELSKIRRVPVFVGGRSILNYQSLARRYGLIPVPGPADQALKTLFAEFERWHAKPT